jgi:outer membrane protein insertion porin family
VEYLPEGIRVTFRIEEGPRYKVGNVMVSGELVRASEELVEKLRTAKTDFFSREIVRNDVLMLTDLYSDEGYAYAEISPRVVPNRDTLTVDIDFTAAKGPLVYFEKIIIAGNTKTRDKVIRRELEVYEQELYNGVKLKKGVRNLFRLDYFEDVKVDTTRGASEDSMVLKVEVVEKPTGAFTFGGGYSSVEDAFTMFSISQRNFRGRGQVLQARAQLGGVTNKFSLIFTEPWLFDIPLSATLEAYNWEVDYDYYDKDSIGAGLRLSYPFWENVRLYWGYRIDLSEVTDISPDASNSIWQMEGENLTSSTEVAIRYDSRNRLFNATEGSMHGISLEYAGLGGDVGFIKTEAETSWYFPLTKSFTGFLRAKGGMIENASGKLLPDYEKFYLGGINSLRGFRWEDLAPREPSRHPDYPGELVGVGGDKYVQFNAELIFPIDEESGVVGVVFFDTGEVFGSDENVDFGRLRESIGGGIRWYSPVGPIRVEYGHILDPKEGFGEGGRWEFTMGAAF